MTPSVTSERKAWTTSKRILAVGTLILIALGALIRQAAPNSPAVVRLSSGPSSVVSTSRPNAEEAAFASLKTGMSYKQAVTILGSEGEEIASNEMSGVKTVLCEWKGGKLWATKNAVFQNDKLINKKRFGME